MRLDLVVTTGEVDLMVDVHGPPWMTTRDAIALGRALEPLLKTVQTALRQTESGRRNKGAPRARRRAVMAAE